ncbi:MAG TPA: hypothetical protein VF894_04805 [Anaeromyxobacter sp.]
MLAIALTVVSAAALTAAIVTVRLSRRRARRDVGLASRLEPLPAGVKHLAATVSDLSDLGIHLHAARRAASMRKPRLGVLLGLR